MSSVGGLPTASNVACVRPIQIQPTEEPRNSQSQDVSKDPCTLLDNIITIAPMEEEQVYKTVSVTINGVSKDVKVPMSHPAKAKIIPAQSGLLNQSSTIVVMPNESASSVHYSSLGSSGDGPTEPEARPDETAKTQHILRPTNTVSMQPKLSSLLGIQKPPPICITTRTSNGMPIKIVTSSTDVSSSSTTQTQTGSSQHQLLIGSTTENGQLILVQSKGNAGVKHKTLTNLPGNSVINVQTQKPKSTTIVYPPKSTNTSVINPHKPSSTAMVQTPQMKSTTIIKPTSSATVGVLQTVPKPQVQYKIATSKSSSQQTGGIPGFLGSDGKFYVQVDSLNPPAPSKSSAVKPMGTQFCVLPASQAAAKPPFGAKYLNSNIVQHGSNTSSGNKLRMTVTRNGLQSAITQPPEMETNLRIESIFSLKDQDSLTTMGASITNTRLSNTTSTAVSSSSFGTITVPSTSSTVPLQRKKFLGEINISDDEDTTQPPNPKAAKQSILGIMEADTQNALRLNPSGASAQIKSILSIMESDAQDGIQKSTPIPVTSSGFSPTSSNANSLFYIMNQGSRVSDAAKNITISSQSDNTQFIVLNAPSTSDQGSTVAQTQVSTREPAIRLQVQSSRTNDHLPSTADEISSSGPQHPRNTARKSFGRMQRTPSTESKGDEVVTRIKSRFPELRDFSIPVEKLDISRRKTSINVNRLAAYLKQRQKYKAWQKNRPKRAKKANKKIKTEPIEEEQYVKETEIKREVNRPQTPRDNSESQLSKQEASNSQNNKDESPKALNDAGQSRRKQVMVTKECTCEPAPSAAIQQASLAFINKTLQKKAQRTVLTQAQLLEREKSKFLLIKTSNANYLMPVQAGVSPLSVAQQLSSKTSASVTVLTNNATQSSSSTVPKQSIPVLTTASGSDLNTSSLLQDIRIKAEPSSIGYGDAAGSILQSVSNTSRFVIRPVQSSQTLVSQAEAVVPSHTTSISLPSAVIAATAVKAPEKPVPAVENPVPPVQDVPAGKRKLVEADVDPNANPEKRPCTNEKDVAEKPKSSMDRIRELKEKLKTQELALKEAREQREKTTKILEEMD